MPFEREIDLHFPKAGIDVTVPEGSWPMRWGPNREKHYSCVQGVNVRSFDPATGRQRGGSRSGLSKYIPTQVVADWVVQHLGVIVASDITPPGGNPLQPSQSGRVVTLVAVGQGNVYVANPGDTTWTAATLDAGVGTPPLNFDGVIFSAALSEKLYFVDGATPGTHVPVYYDPSSNTVFEWTVNADSDFPVDDDDNTPRIIEPWRSRLLLAGLLGDPQNIFACKQGDASDFDYLPALPSGQDAWALNIPDGLGLIGDIVTGIVPWSEDLAIVLGDHTVNMISGDPLAGGFIENISQAIGGAWGRAWCIAPDGTVYFFGNIPGIYAIPPGSKQLTRISGPIDPLLATVNTGTTSIRLTWNDKARGFHVFITELTGEDDATHYFYETMRSDGSGNAWWQDQFADNNMNPLCCVTIDGNETDDRSLVIGSFDGYVRKVDEDADDDDGTPIACRVKIGPLLTPNMDQITLLAMQGSFGNGSADVDYDIYLGRTPELALASTPIATVTGTFGADLGYTKLVNRGDRAIFLDLHTTAGQWAMESIRATIRSIPSDTRRRGKI